MANTREAWSIWAGEHQVRWADGRIYGTAELVAELNSRLNGEPFAVTPTGPFLEASLDDPLVVAAIAQQALRDLGFRPDQIGASPNMPTPPPIPEGAVG